MPMNDAIHTRLDSLETAVRLMSDRVVALADFMERLVVLEERNSFRHHPVSQGRVHRSDR